MKKWFVDAVESARQRMRDWADALKGRMDGFQLSWDRLSRIGWYGSLALLLLLLGSASWAYRTAKRPSTAQRSEPERAVISIPAPAATPLPAATAQPVVWQRPLEGKVVGEYSPDETIWSETLGQWQTHPAIDIAGSPGEAVYACRAGTVLDAWRDRLWGNVILLEHDDGYRSTYASLNTLELVEPGQHVEAGEVIASVGQSAACEADMGWHLHFELTKDGAPADLQTLLDQM